MPVNDDKVKLYGELAKIDPFEFWDTNLIPENLSPELKKLKKRHWLYIIYPELYIQNPLLKTGKKKWH